VVPLCVVGDGVMGVVFRDGVWSFFSYSDETSCADTCARSQ